MTPVSPRRLSRNSASVSPGRNPGHCAFTLTEMLAVVAILGVIALLALPAYQSVREKMDAAQCLSNLREVVSAFNRYANDNDLFYPTVANDDWVKPAEGIYYYAVPDALRISGWYWDVNNPKGYTNKFKGTVLSCPTQERKKPNKWSYGMNELMCREVQIRKASDGSAYPRITQLTQPSKAAIVMETAGFIRIKTPGTGQEKEPETIPRHGPYISVGFADGHVEAIDPKEIPKDSKDPFWAIRGN